VEVVASLSQGRTAAAHCGLFTYKSVPVIFEPPCIQRKPASWNVTPCSYQCFTENYLLNLSAFLCTSVTLQLIFAFFRTLLRTENFQFFV